VKIAAQSGVTKNINQENIVVQGSPPLDFTHYQRCYVVFKNLPDLRNQVIELEKKVAALS
jgi:UDP-3-O-[3-hydroxymyristoyl] glucosamine N-acyltransferase